MVTMLGKKPPVEAITPESLSDVVMLKAVQTGNYYFSQYFNIAQGENTLNFALNEYMKALELSPCNISLLGRIARVYMRLGNIEKARRFAYRALENTPYGIKDSSERMPEQILSEGKADHRHHEALYTLGFLAYKAQQYEQAIFYLKQSLNCQRWRSSRVRFCLGYAMLESSSQEKRVRSLLQQWLCKMSAVFQFILGMCLIPWETAALPFQDFGKMLPQLVRLYRFEAQQKSEEAISVAHELVQQYPGLPAVCNILANLYHHQGDVENSRFWYERALRRDPLQEESYIGLAHLYEEDAEYGDAELMYDKMLTFRPGDADIHCNLGNLYYLRRDFKQALAYYQSALQLGKESNKENRWQGQVAQSIAHIYHEQLDNHDAAILAYQTAVDLDPREMNNHIYLGILYFEKGDFINARTVYERALSVDPKNAQIYCNLAFLEWTEEKIPKAIEYYEHSIQLDPFYDIPYNNLGVIYMDHFGQMARSVELLKRATELNANYALAHYNLGRAHSLMDDKLQAASCFQRAQELNEYTRELDNEELTERIHELFDLPDVS